MRRARSSVVWVLLLLAGCASTAPAGSPAPRAEASVGAAVPGDGVPRTVPPGSADPEAAAAAEANLRAVAGVEDPAPSDPLPVFTACSRDAAPPGTSFLRSTGPDAPGWPAELADGRLVVEHVADLTLTGGWLAAGNGFDAAFGGVRGVRVADATVDAVVNLGVLDSPSTGRRVAFAELRLGDRPPVGWQEEPALGFVTDGGDGGFVAMGGPESRAGGWDSTAHERGIHDYVEAFFPGGDSGSGHVCVLREPAGGRVDGFLFSSGWGDGGYPTFLGRSADGEVVSVVSYGWVLPWEVAGMPGTPPPVEY